MNWVCEDLLANAVSAGAKVIFNTLATKDIIDSYSPQIVINATGGNAVHPKAFSGNNISTVTEILDGSVKLKNKNVARE